MIDLSFLRGSRVAALGLARSGLAACRALSAAGVPVAAWDDDAGARAKAEASGAMLVDLAAADWGRYDVLLLSPGIPLWKPAPAAARAGGVAVICDVELLARACPKARFVGITGTNGKSTTTALIGHTLARAGVDVEVGGNIGEAVLGLRPLGEGGVYVIEMSSFQLDLVDRSRFDVAIWTNLTPDHVDHHQGLDNYVAAKKRIFRGQRSGDLAVVGVDDEASLAVADELAVRAGAALVRIAVGRRPAGAVSVVDGVLETPEGERLDLRSMPTLPGAHNWQNAACAYVACRALGVAPDAVAAGFADFPGLAHRQERVARAGGAVWINDSKATNVDAAEQALRTYEPIYWIAGGKTDDDSIARLEPYFGRIAHAFLVGKSGPAFARQLEAKRVACTMSGDLGTAVAQADARVRSEAKAGAVVLLSPACKSWDQWPSYEARGDAFRAMARALPGAEPLGGRVA